MSNFRNFKFEKTVQTNKRSIRLSLHAMHREVRSGTKRTSKWVPENARVVRSFHAWVLLLRSAPVADHSRAMTSGVESLGIVVDAGRTLSADEFASARDLAFRVARRQLLSGKIAANGDKVAVVAIGAAETRNEMFAAGDSDKAKFAGVAVVSSASRLSIDLLRRVLALQQGGRSDKVIYTAGLDVAASHVYQRSGKACTSKRVMLVTDGKGKIAGTRDKSVNELYSFASICLKCDITFSVIFIDGLNADDWTVLGDETDDEMDDSDTDSDDDERQPSEDDDGDTEELLASKRRAWRLFSGWRIDHEFSRRKRVHEAAATARDHRMPTDATLLKQTLLARLALVLENGSLSLAQALVEIDKPRFKAKKPSVKFHGVLDIGHAVKIPVKTYSRVAPATRPTSKRLSWASTVAKRRLIYAKTERRYVTPPKQKDETFAAGKDDDDDDDDDDESDAEEESRDVEEEDIGEAVHYGPGLFEVPDEAMGISLDLRCDKVFSILAFVPKGKIPLTSFMGGVDVVLPMSGPEKCGPQRAMRGLVRAMLDLDCGAIARYCSGRGVNPKPEFMYLWPAKKSAGREKAGGEEDEEVDEMDENDEEKLLVDVYFCYMVKIPVFPDVRDFPFASLKETIDDIDQDSQRHMDRFVAARDLDCDISPDLMSQDSRRTSVPESEVEPVRNANETEIPEGSFDPSERCNPVIDRFFVAIVQRALEGGEGVSGLPELPVWAQTLVNPRHVLRKANAVAAKNAAVALKNAFPLTEVEASSKKRREQVHVAIATGSELDTSHLFPPGQVENEGEIDMERASSYRPEGYEDDEEVAEYGNATSFGDAPDARAPTLDEEGTGVGEENEESDGSDGAMSTVTDCPMFLSREAPVSDLKVLIRAKRADEAIEMMSDMIRSLIRDGDLVLAGDCFVALRRACAKLSVQDTFNLLFDRLVWRLYKPSPQGNAATAFLRHMKRDPKRARYLAPLYPRDAALVKRMDPAADVLANVALAIQKLSLADHSGAGNARTTSGVTMSGVTGATR